MITTTVTLGSLVDRAMFELQGPTEVALASTLAATIDSDDTTFTLASATAVNVNDVLELDSELVLVTGKSADAVPVLTVWRGYYNSVPAAHTVGLPVFINPRYPRVRTAEAVRRCFSRLEALGLPLFVTDTFGRVVDQKAVIMPAETRDVVRVGYFAEDGRYWDLDGWEFIDDMPAAKVSTGKLLRIPRYIGNEDDIEITYRTPYRWSTHPAEPTEVSTITMIEGTEDLPVLYATAWLAARREIARTEIDRAEEWTAGEPSRGGVSAAVVRLQWQEFYRALDEAKRLVPVFPVHRPYRKMQRLTR
jgi:hypothetical protein